MVMVGVYLNIFILVLVFQIIIGRKNSPDTEAVQNVTNNFGYPAWVFTNLERDRIRKMKHEMTIINWIFFVGFWISFISVICCMCIVQ